MSEPEVKQARRWPPWTRRHTWVAVAVVLLAVAATLFTFVGRDQHHAPRPPAAQATTSLVSSTAPTTATPTKRASTKAKPTATRSTQPPAPGTGTQPIHIAIPSIGVQSNLLLLGLNDDRTIEVPPLSNVGEAGWYRFSPTPGAVGPAVILGHIDSAVAGKGVFYDLGRVRQGDQVVILRADHRTATFNVTRVLETPKTAFPTQQVYGNTAGPELRLITCGGQFDSRARSYLDNIIVFGALTSLR